MNNALIQCPACQAWLMGGPFNQREFGPCPACGVPLRGEVFPALFRKFSASQSGEAIIVEGESSCFYHPQKKAVLPCDSCGRFLCALCDCQLQGKHFCPTCLEAGRTKGKIKSLENQRTLYDSIALALAIYPLITVLLYMITVITAPMALFVAIRYWKAPLSIVRRTRIRFIVAILIALLTIAGWIIHFSI
ncbi:MAG TPA: hypothetical protein VMH87_15345 [Pseudomonadales bacterium]|nr:hypothetical protein [Pseudomonadales bacterium]